MTFKTCRKCGYRHVPQEYGHCPKCNASMAFPRTIKLALRGVGFLALALGLFYIAIYLLPRISVTIR